MTLKDSAVALGSGTIASAEDALSLGSYANASKDTAVALGPMQKLTVKPVNYSVMYRA